MLPFETLDKAELNSVRLDLVHQLQCFKCSTEDIQTLRDILVDILNLQHGLEDNLLVIQQIHQVDPGTGEDYKELALNTARQHIIDINSVYQQGLDWLRNDQACDTLGSDNIGEDIKVEITEVPGLDFDQFPSNCSEIKNNVVLIPRSDSAYDNLLPIDHEGNVSNTREKNQQRVMSDGRRICRGSNWSDQQTACFKSLITTLDGGDIYATILSTNMTKEGKERKKRAWNRVLRKFRKIPGNEDFQLKHLASKFKNLKNRKKEFPEERMFQAVQADGSPYSPSNGLEWMKNDQSCNAFGSEEYIKVVPDLDLDQISSDEEEITEQSIAEHDNLLSVDYEENVSNISEKNQQRVMSDGRRICRGSNWSDQQTACFKSLISTLDGGDIYAAIFSTNMTKEGKERKKRAWDRVLRKFRKIPGNEDFELKHLLSKFKNLKNRNKELQEEVKFLADDLSHSPFNGLEWMRKDQSCDTHGAEEDFKVALEVDLNEIPSDNEEITEKCITEFDNLLPIDHEGNLSNISAKNQQRVVSGRRKGRRAPNWSDEQAACLQDLITTLDGGDVYAAILSTSMTKEWRERKKRAWDKVYRMFRKIPGNEVFKLKHLFSKFKNLRNCNKELIEDRRFQAVQPDGLSHYPNNGSDWMGNDQSCDTLGSEEYIKVDPDQDLDQISTDDEEKTDQSTTECFPIDQEGNSSNTFDGRMDGRMVNSASASEKSRRAPNWSDQQAAFLQGLIKTLDGGHIYKAILSTMKTKENRTRKKRAWDRVYREFRKIPGNEVFKLNHLVSKFKNIRNFGNEISDERIYEVVQSSVPLPLSTHIGWMRNDQVDPDQDLDPDYDLDQVSLDCLENQNNKNMNEKRLSNSEVGGKCDRSPNWSDQQTACLQDLIKSLDGGEIYTALLSTIKTKENRARKKRAWDRVYREFRRMPGHEEFRLKHLVSKFKNIKNYKKELVQRPDNTVCEPTSLSSPTEKDPIKPPPFSREQTRLLLEIVKNVRVNQEQKEIIDSPSNKPELIEKKNEVWRNIHAQFIERSDCNWFSAQYLRGKYRNIVFQRGGQKNFDGSEESLQNNPIQQENTTYYRPILPKLPEENSPEFLEVPVKVEIHDGEEERNPLDVPVKVEITDEEDPLQIL